MNIEVEIQDFLEKFVELVLKAGLSISLSILVSKTGLLLGLVRNRAKMADIW